MATNDVRADADFYARLPVFAGFPQIMDPARYQPLAGRLADRSHRRRAFDRAIEAGRYKAVNTAGASVIAAVTNALKERPFPFVFGGDGASIAVPARDEEAVRAALAATAAWARDELGLCAARGARSRFGRARAGARRQGRPVRAVGQRLVRDVHRRRAGLGRPHAEGRTLCGDPGRAGRSAGPLRTVVPLERHPDVARRHPVAGGGAGHGRATRRSAALVDALLAELETSPSVARPVPDGAPGVGWPPARVWISRRARRAAAGSALDARELRAIG